MPEDRFPFPERSCLVANTVYKIPFFCSVPPGREGMVTLMTFLGTLGLKLNWDQMQEIAEMPLVARYV